MINYKIIYGEEVDSVVAFDPNRADPLLTADSNHPNWDAIVEALDNGDEHAFDLFDVGAGVVRRMLSDRVEYIDGVIYFDGSPREDALTSHLVRSVQAGADNSDLNAIVNFWESLQNNPSHHSREQLLNWLTHHDFSITEEGQIIAYKGVRNINGDFYSVHSGRATVDGELIEGRIPNYIGAVVTMPRSEVSDNPNVACHAGLHCATFEFGARFASDGTTLEVHVWPEDVVSVPHDSNVQKVRCCRYEVARVAESAHTAPVVRASV